MTRRLLILCTLLGACHSKPSASALSPLRAWRVAPPAIVAVLPDPLRGAVGDTIFIGINLIVNGVSVSCAPTTWESLNPEVASFLGPGLLQVHRADSTTIRATCEGHVATVIGRFTP